MKNHRVYVAIKKIMDVFISIMGIILMIPIMIIIFFLKIHFKDKSKLFFIQDRIGKNGRIFKMYKFTTMIENAEEILEEELKINTVLSEEYKLNKKIENDFRVTAVGKMLRRTNIDEWPQFFNILKGDMSLVGPRPYLPKEKKEMREAYSTITKIKPGLTGLWQVRSDKDRSFKKRLQLDIQYCKIQKISLDIKIIFKTIWQIVKEIFIKNEVIIKENTNEN